MPLRWPRFMLPNTYLSIKIQARAVQAFDQVRSLLLETKPLTFQPEVNRETAQVTSGWFGCWAAGSPLPPVMGPGFLGAASQCRLFWKFWGAPAASVLQQSTYQRSLVQFCNAPVHLLAEKRGSSHSGQFPARQSMLKDDWILPNRLEHKAS